MVVSISESFLIFSVLICLPGCSYSRQDVIHAAAGNKNINHGCPSPSTTVQTAANVVSQSTIQEGWCFVIHKSDPGASIALHGL